MRIVDIYRKEWVSEVGLAKGEPENPATWEELYNKFHNNATSLLSEKEAKKLGNNIMDLENLAIDEITRLT